MLLMYVTVQAVIVPINEINYGLQFAQCMSYI